MKHMTLYCHGSVSVAIQGEGLERYVEPPKATIPDNVTVIFYIPPGTVFNALSGVKLFNRIRNRYDADKQSTDVLVKTISAGMKAKSRDKDYSDRLPRSDMSFWASQTNLSDYPRVCTSQKNNEYAYNYNLRGMKPTDHSSLAMVSWGLHEAGFGGRVIKALGPEATSTLNEMLEEAAGAADGEGATVHCIFCRVERLEGEVSAFAHHSMQTSSLGFVTISFD